MAPTLGEEVRQEKGKGAEVTKCLVHGRDDGKADPRYHLQGVR